MTSRNRGFTLIEILVVISIIGLLSAIVLASLNSARGKGRDAARVVDVRELKKAIEFYYNDKPTPTYPIIGARNAANSISSLNGPLTSPTKYISGIAQTLVDGSGVETNYYGWGSASGSATNADSYAIAVYTEAGAAAGYPGGLCKTGAGPSLSSIMPSLTTLCNF